MSFPVLIGAPPRGAPFDRIGYSALLQGTQSDDLIAHWRLNETSGSTADNAEGTADRDGTYTGVTLADVDGILDESKAPLFDGANDFVDIYSASLNTAFNVAEGTLLGWFRLSTDAAGQNVGVALRADGNNRVTLLLTAAEFLQWIYGAGGTFENVSRAVATEELVWIFMAMTWSVAANQMKAYLNGSQFGSTQTGLGTWSGALASDQVNIGVRDNSPSLVQPWEGHICHVAVWTTPLTGAEILALA